MKALELFLISFAALCSANDLSNSWSYSTCSSSKYQSAKISFNCTLCWEAGYEVELGAKITVIPSDPTSTHEFKTDGVEFDRSKKNIAVIVSRVDQHKGWNRMPITVIVEETGKAYCSDAPSQTFNVKPYSATGIITPGRVLVFGTGATYNCFSGLSISFTSSATITCITGTWNPSVAPKCLLVCPGTLNTNGLEPTYNPSAITISDFGKVYRSGTVATYTCSSDSANSNSATITCTSGSWVPDVELQCQQSG